MHTKKAYAVSCTFTYSLDSRNYLTEGNRQRSDRGTKRVRPYAFSCLEDRYHNSDNELPQSCSTILARRSLSYVCQACISSKDALRTSLWSFPKELLHCTGQRQARKSKNSTKWSRCSTRTKAEPAGLVTS